MNAIETERVEVRLHEGLLRDDLREAKAAIDRVTALHKPYGIYDECGHDHSEAELDDPNSPVIEVDDIGLTCEAGLMYRVCEHCCTSGKHFYDFQTEECISAHEHGTDEPICPTMAAIAGGES